MLPDFPTNSEAGVPGLEIETWYALYAPKGTPRDVIDLLARAIAKISEGDDFKARVGMSGATISYMEPDELDGFTQTQVAHWTHIIRKLGITAQ